MSVTWSDPPGRRAPRSVQSVRAISARQRVVVITFPDEDAAQAWDDAGQPVTVP